MSEKLNDNLENLNKNETEVLDGGNIYAKGDVKLEENDNWEFEATAHTLEDTVLENDEIEISLPKKEAVAQTRERPKTVQPEKTESAKKSEKSDSKNIILFVLTGVIAVIVIGVLAFFGFRYYTVPNINETMNPGNVALSVDGEKISVGLYNYYYNSIVDTYVSQAQQGTITDLNPQKDYSKQNTTNADGKTVKWTERFVDETEFQLQQLVAFYKAGVKDGMTLTKDEKKEIKETVDSIKEQASENDMSVDEYISVNYGDHCGLAAIKKMLNYNYIARKYLQKYNIVTKATNKQIKKYFEDNKEDYTAITVGYLIVNYDDTNKDAQIKKAKEYEAKIKSLDDIKKLVPEAYADVVKSYVEQGVATEEAAIKEIEKQITMDVKGSDQYFVDEANTWLFSDKTPVGSVKLFNDKEKNMCYILVKTNEPTVDETEVYSVRHILIQPERETDEATGQQKEATDEAWKAAEEKAGKVLTQYQKGDRDEYSFALLAEEYSEDPGSISTQGSGVYGGVYSGVKKGDMVKEFEDWALNDARQYGDVEIVKTDYGYHIMFFIEKLPQYLFDAENNLVSTELTEKFIDGYVLKENRTGMKNTTVAKPESDNGTSVVSGSATE